MAIKSINGIPVGAPATSNKITAQTSMFAAGSTTDTTSILDRDDYGYVDSAPFRTRKAPCYATHKPVKLGNGTFFGGSCAHPQVDDADVYVGLDLSMPVRPRSFPWMPGVEFVFPIRDHDVPSDPKQFKHLIAYLAGQLDAGAKVHVGCIGGHGRTGMVLAALRAHMAQDKGAIEHVRANYCHRAVESLQQVEFLVEHFGVTPAKGSDHGKFKSGGAGGAGHKFAGPGSATLFDELSPGFSKFPAQNLPVATTVHEPSDE